MQWLAKLLIGSALSPVINAALGWQKQKLEAAGSQDARIAELAQQQIALDRREAEVNADVVKAEQGNWMTRWVRPVWAIPFIAFTFKAVMFDKVIGSFIGCSGPKAHAMAECSIYRTDPLDPNMWGVFMAMVIAYYGSRSAEKIATKIAGVIKR